MRQIIKVIVLLAAFFAVYALSAVVGNAQSKPKYFGAGGNGQKCEDARQSGNYTPYKPTYFSTHRGIKGNEEIRGLETSQCIELYTVIGYQWVVQDEDTRYIFEKIEVNGTKTLKMVAREDCGNLVRSVYQQKHIVVAEETKVQKKECPPGTTPGSTEGICIEVKTVTNTVTETVYPCPVFTGARYGTKGWKARFPSPWELLVGAGKGAAIAYIGSNENRGKAALISGVASAIDTTATNMFVPDYNILYLQGPYALSVKKGKTVTSPDGLFILSWEKDDAIYGRLATGEVCFAGAVKNGFNTGSIAIVNRKGGVKQTIPIKTQNPGTQPSTGGVIANNGGQLPGGGVPTNPTGAIPTRPRIGGNNLVDTAYGNQTMNGQNLFSSSATNTPAASQSQEAGVRSAGVAYRRVKINGVVQLVKVQ